MILPLPLPLLLLNPPVDKQTNQTCKESSQTEGLISVSRQAGGQAAVIEETSGTTGSSTFTNARTPCKQMHVTSCSLAKVLTCMYTF